MDKVSDELTINVILSRRQMRGVLLAALSAAAGLATASETSIIANLPSPSGVFRRLITTMDVVLARDGGRVGIGTASPAAKLDVSGGLRVSQDGEFGGRAAFGGAFPSYSAGVSIRNGNLQVEGNENDQWLRVGDAWGFNAVYSESGDLALGADTGRVHVGNPGSNKARLAVSGTIEASGDVCSGQGDARRCLQSPPQTQEIASLPTSDCKASGKAHRWFVPYCPAGYYFKAGVKATDGDWDGYSAICCSVTAKSGTSYNALVAQCNAAPANFGQDRVTCPPSD